jgi:hypothetical protein
MIIGLTGKLESGKSTLAKEIQKRQKEGGVSILAFAKPLKDICLLSFGFTHDDLYTTEGKTKMNDFWGMTPRVFMQKLGQGLRDGIAPDVWVKLTKMEILKKKDIYTHVIVEDCRMPNECEMIRSLGGIIVRVIRPNHVAISNGIKNHPSEQDLPDDLIDYEIVNDGTADQLYDVFHTLLPNV